MHSNWKNNKGNWVMSIAVLVILIIVIGIIISAAHNSMSTSGSLLTGLATLWPLWTFCLVLFGIFLGVFFYNRNQTKKAEFAKIKNEEGAASEKDASKEKVVETTADSKKKTNWSRLLLMITGAFAILFISLYPRQTYYILLAFVVIAIIIYGLYRFGIIPYLIGFLVLGLIARGLSNHISNLNTKAREEREATSQLVDEASRHSPEGWAENTSNTEKYPKFILFPKDKTVSAPIYPASDKDVYYPTIGGIKMVEVLTTSPTGAIIRKIYFERHGFQDNIVIRYREETSSKFSAK